MSWQRPTSTYQAKVIVLVPHRDEKDYRQWRDWWHRGLQKPEGTTWLETRGLSLTTNRTQLIRMALASDATHFFFLDDDVIPPDNVIPALLSLNVPVACGLYMTKKEKGRRCLSAWMRKGAGYAAIGPEQKGRFVTVDVTALGCAMIHRSVFEKLPEPWFVWNPEGPSEDFWFFEKLFKKSNVKPVIDMEVRCLHLGIFALDTNNEFDTLKL